MQPGAILRLLATDPMAVIDVPNFCREAGPRALSSEALDGHHHIQDQAHMTYDFGEFNNWGALKTVAIRTPEAAFVSQARVDAEWKELNFHSRPDFAEARREYETVLAALARRRRRSHRPAGRRWTDPRQPLYA